MSKSWKLDELAERAGVSARTIRYYVQRGLLPAPVFRGRDTAYGEEHLRLLGTIRAMQERHLPLDRIQAELEGRTRDDAPEHEPKPEPEPKPSATHSSHVSPPAGVRLERWVLTPGLELQVDEDAEPHVRALAEILRNAASEELRKKSRR
jgi:Ca-activated chloride channel family protein